MNTLTTTIYEHRDWVPPWTIAITFADLKFTGNNADKYNEEWSNIQHELNDPYYARMNKIEDNKDKIKFYQKILDNKPWYKFWDSKEEAAAKTRINDLCVENRDLDKELEELDDDFKERCAIEDFLKKHNFAFVRRNTWGDECCAYTDIYELRN